MKTMFSRKELVHESVEYMHAAIRQAYINHDVSYLDVARYHIVVLEHLRLINVDKSVWLEKIIWNVRQEIKD